MQHSCRQCQSSFDVTSDDFAFYDKVSPVFVGKKYPIPPPTHCSDCRAQRRQARFNYEYLYRRTSDKTGRSIISAVSADKPYKVFEPSEWWADGWDAFDYGRDVNFKRPFFDQMHELLLEVPVMSLVVDGNENSEYVQYSGWDKNCYLCFCTDYSEDCLYTHSVYYSKNTVDSFFSYTLELCYECVYCNTCYNLTFSQNCHSCSDSSFLFDCQNCKECFGCTGLRNTEYCLFNEQLSKEEYFDRLKEFPLSDLGTHDVVRGKREPLLLAQPRRPSIGLNNENVLGDYLFNCKNAQWCFDCTDLEDSKYCNSMRGGKDCMDVSHWGHPAELCYECAGVGEGASHLLFCECCWPNCSDLYYCSNCTACHDCFSCAGLKHKRYCIFNKQYGQEEYTQLVPRIIDHMRRDGSGGAMNRGEATGSWGEYHPVRLSPFCYNESPSQRYYPLTKEEVLARGWRWKDETEEIPKVDRIIPAERLPDSIDEIPDDVLNWAIECEATKRPFRIIKQELAFYRKQKLPLPHFHPDERHRRRMALRNPRKLWSRTCAKCSKEIQTTYPPSRLEVVYCESCYLAAVY